ncbi:MAG: lysophospholipid acyltransferase family protein [Myxococcota bacterium]|nr:lysophospholipid acyltransferase family protein [Myxococcota bacterium]
MEGAERLEESVPQTADWEHLARMDRSMLSGFERISLPVCDGVNSSPRLKSLLQFFVRTVSATWIFGIAFRRLVLTGLEHVRALDPPRGVILVSNHRSFFDMYVCSAVLYKRARFLRRLHFPVRSNFFYTNPVGLLVNLLVSGCAMWPPVFRDDRRLLLNPVGMAQTAHVLGRQGSVVGYHPEGTRGKGPDPYQFLPIRKGIGLLVSRCHPETVILPYFILGLSNSMGTEIKACARPRAGENDIRLSFGAPVRVGDLTPNLPPAQLAEEVMDLVRSLAEDDRTRAST